MKKPHQSKTIIFNIATGLVATANELLPLLEVFEESDAQQLRLLIVLVSVIGNLILRFLTTTAIR